MTSLLRPVIWNGNQFDNWKWWFHYIRHLNIEPWFYCGWSDVIMIRAQWEFSYQHPAPGGRVPSPTEGNQGSNDRLLINSPAVKFVLCVSFGMSIRSGKPVADLRGAWGTHAPPRHPNSFNFMQFLGELGKIVCSRPPPPPPWRVHAPLGEILDPSLETFSVHFPKNTLWSDWMGANVWLNLLLLLLMILQRNLPVTTECFKTQARKRTQFWLVRN